MGQFQELKDSYKKAKLAKEKKSLLEKELEGLVNIFIESIKNKWECSCDCIFLIDRNNCKKSCTEQNLSNVIQKIWGCWQFRVFFILGDNAQEGKEMDFTIQVKSDNKFLLASNNIKPIEIEYNITKSYEEVSPAFSEFIENIYQRFLDLFGKGEV